MVNPKLHSLIWLSCNISTTILASKVIALPLTVPWPAAITMTVLEIPCSPQYNLAQRGGFIGDSIGKTVIVFLLAVF